MAQHPEEVRGSSRQCVGWGQSTSVDVCERISNVVEANLPFRNLQPAANHNWHLPQQLMRSMPD